PPDQGLGALAAFRTSLKLDRHRHELDVRDVHALTIGLEEGQHRCRSRALVPIGERVPLDDVNGVRRRELVEARPTGSARQLSTMATETATACTARAGGSFPTSIDDAAARGRSGGDAGRRGSWCSAAAGARSPRLIVVLPVPRAVTVRLSVGS